MSKLKTIEEMEIELKRISMLNSIITPINFTAPNYNPRNEMHITMYSNTSNVFFYWQDMDLQARAKYHINLYSKYTVIKCFSKYWVMHKKLLIFWIKNSPSYNTYEEAYHHMILTINLKVKDFVKLLPQDKLNQKIDYLAWKASDEEPINSQLEE